MTRNAGVWRRRLRKAAAPGMAALLLAAGTWQAAQGAGPARRTDPDWPCQQPLVPVLAAATVWSGPSLDGIGDWRSEPRVAALVQRIAPRSVDTGIGVKAIEAFTSQLAPGERSRLVTLAFAGLLQETNDERKFLINRIRELGERQRNLAALVSRLDAQFDAIPPGAAGEAQRTDLEQRRLFTSRSFDALQRTMRYACETPVQLDARLGAYARALQSGLS